MMVSRYASPRFRFGEAGGWIKKFAFCTVIFNFDIYILILA